VHDRGSQQEQGCAGQWLDRRSGVGVRRHGGILGRCGSGVKA